MNSLAAVSFRLWTRAAPIILFVRALMYLLSVMSSPVDVTGCPDPIAAPGAIAATWVAIRMYVPAENALAPIGATYPMIGTGLFPIISII